MTDWNRLEHDADAEADEDAGTGEGTKSVVPAPSLNSTHLTKWLPKGRGRTPARRIPRGNSLYCYDNAT